MVSSFYVLTIHLLYTVLFACISCLQLFLFFHYEQPKRDDSGFHCRSQGDDFDGATMCCTIMVRGRYFRNVYREGRIADVVCSINYGATYSDLVEREMHTINSWTSRNRASIFQGLNNLRNGSEKRRTAFRQIFLATKYMLYSD